MAALLLIPDNIQFVKTALRQALPTVKSSHFSEALAFSAGYRTHAALLAAMENALPARPILAEIHSERLSERIEALGYTGFAGVSVDNAVRSSELPVRIWAAFPNGDIAANERWFRECQRRDIPNLRIERRRKYVELHWDCISIDPHGENHVQGDQGTELVRAMFQTYQSVAGRISGKSLFSGSSFVGSVDRLFPELAYELADRFFAMLYEPMRDQSLAA
jgi:hypothetical protein